MTAFINLPGNTELFILAFGLGMAVLWLWALIDAIQNPRLDSNMRLLWVLVIVLTSGIGAILYLIMGRSGSRPA